MKLLVLGLDAATWTVAEPLMSSGHMPTLAALAGDGWSAPLLSTDPPITPPAWTTILTGMDPARHGVYSFCRPDPQS
ncbi:MAG TPA: alkaline phosphatase family protein, partial [Armatimonadota bacterium]|nr:alkaline phosphatase family protein [Armatimonadota bacterium]